MLRRALLTSLPLVAIFLSQSDLNPVQADDPPVDRSVIEAQLRARRDRLKQLEQSVQFERDALKLQLTDFVAGQQAVVALARQELEKAKEATKLTRYQLKEYREGIYVVEKATLNGQISLAKSDLDLTRERRDHLKNLAERGVVAASEFERANLEIQQAEFDVEQSEVQLKVLEGYTKPKEIKVRQAEIDKAEAIEAEKQGIVEVEQARETFYHNQRAESGARSFEDLVISLINKAIAKGNQAVALLAGASKLEAQIREKPTEAASLNTKPGVTGKEAISLMNEAKTLLLEAARLGQQAQAERGKLRDSEERLKKERELLETLEKQLAPGK